MAETNVKPFLRWAGGKRWFLPKLRYFLPEEFSDYHEPFLGGGSVFIYLKSKGIIQNGAVLSDANGDLINAYNAIKRNVDELIERLREHKNSESYYNKLREKRFRNKVARAAQFIFLNRTSFNGIYRVNLDGVYNVPYGFKKYRNLIEEDNFLALSELFQDCNFVKRDFRKTIHSINEGDLVFLDPPYTVAHNLNGFVKYNQKIFSWRDQFRLKRYVEELIELNAHFILTNAAHSSIRELYKEIALIRRLSRFSVIGGVNARRDEFNEYVIHS